MISFYGIAYQGPIRARFMQVGARQTVATVFEPDIAQAVTTENVSRVA